MIDGVPDKAFRFAALDVETACGDSSSICQIGLAFVDWDGRIYQHATYVDPLLPFAPFNIQLHGIGPDTVRGAPRFPKIWRALYPALVRQPLFQHSRFDEKAIEAACRVGGVPRPQLTWCNSVQIARIAWPEFKGQGGHGLGHLKTALGLEFTHHDAGEDARAAAQVVLRAEAHLGRSFDQILPDCGPFQMSLPL